MALNEAQLHSFLETICEERNQVGMMSSTEGLQGLLVEEKRDATCSEPPLVSHSLFSVGFLYKNPFTCKAGALASLEMREVVTAPVKMN